MKSDSLSTVVGKCQLTPREDEIRSLFLYVQSDLNAFLKDGYFHSRTVPTILSIIAKLDEGCIVCYNIGYCKL